MKTVDSDCGFFMSEEGIPTTEAVEESSAAGVDNGGDLDLDPVQMVIYSEILSPKWK